MPAKKIMRKALPLVTIALIVFALYYIAAFWNWNWNRDGNQILSRLLPSPSSSFAGGNFSTYELQALERVLSKAAFRNNTVIITTLNRAWASEGSMLDMFLNSFHRGENIGQFLDHLVIVALDQPSHDRCKAVHKLCFSLRTEGVDFSGEKVFMSDDYVKMMWRRIHLLGAVLQLGYNFVFTDADVLWFRDPFKHFHPRADFEIACDHFPNSHGDSPVANGGFVHVVSSNRTIDLYAFWYKARLSHPNKHDQDVLNALILEDDIWKLNVKIRFLKTEVFGSFCQVRNSGDEICTMHANCCIGLERKMSDLRLVEQDWQNFTSMPSHWLRKNFRWRAPVECLHSFDT